MVLPNTGEIVQEQHVAEHFDEIRDVEKCVETRSRVFKGNRFCLGWWTLYFWK